MITICREGELGPLAALELRTELAAACDGWRCDVTLDLTQVSALHPAVIAVIVDGAARVRQQAGSFRFLEPEGQQACRALSLVSIGTLLR